MARVLVIDDEATNLELVKDIVESIGHDVILAHDGKQGLEAFQAEVPDLVITDIMMPEMDGLTLIQEIRTTAPEQYIIALAAAGAIALTQALEVGANQAIEKPFHIQHLLDSVQTALGA